MIYADNENGREITWEVRRRLFEAMFVEIHEVKVDDKIINQIWPLTIGNHLLRFGAIVQDAVEND